MDRDTNIDRRVFVTIAAGAVAEIAAARVLPPVSEPELSDWTVDGMAGHRPRYAEPIGYGRPNSPGPANPLDTLFVV
jgi:hypothetical protein